MSNSLTATFVFALAILLSLSACNGVDQDYIKLKNKEDSIRFVRSVIDKYPAAQGPKIAGFGGVGKLAKIPGAPIDWDKMLNYKSYYDTFPLIKGKEGFLIDTALFSTLKSNPKYKQIGLMFGKYTKDDNIVDDYSIFIIPLDVDTNVIYKGKAIRGIKTADNNYDYLDPCPIACPKGLN